MRKPKPSTSRRQRGQRKGAKRVHSTEAGQADNDSHFDVLLTFNDSKVSSMQSSGDATFVTASVELLCRPGIHDRIMKVDTRMQGNTLPLATLGMVYHRRR